MSCYAEGCCRAALHSEGFAHDHTEWLVEAKELRATVDRLTIERDEARLLLTAARDDDGWDPGAMVMLYDQQHDRAEKAEAERDEALRKAQVHLELAARRGVDRDRAVRERDRALRERDEYHALFDLQWVRTEAATARWRKEAPEERAHVTPDLGVLLDWLLSQCVPADEETAT